MAKWSWVTFVCVVAVPAGALALAAEGCSSSSSPAAPQNDASSPETSGTATSPDSGPPSVDGGAISLTWGTAFVDRLGGILPEGGPDAAPSDAGASNGGADTDGEVDGAATTSTYMGAYNGNDGGPPAVPGTQICAYPYARVTGGTLPPQSSALTCVTTAADGTFVIPNVPIRTNLVLTAIKAGLMPIVLSIQTASSPMDERANPIFMYSTAIQTQPVPGITVDWQNTGQIIVFAVALDGDGGTSGGSVSMNADDDASPPSGNGPIYENTQFDYVPSATTFLPNGFASTAYYFNVAAGLHTLTLSDQAQDCEPGLMPFAAWGFPLVTPLHSIQVLVLDGYLSGAVGFLCSPNPVIVGVDGG